MKHADKNQRLDTEHPDTNLGEHFDVPDFEPEPAGESVAAGGASAAGIPAASTGVVGETRQAVTPDVPGASAAATQNASGTSTFDSATDTAEPAELDSGLQETIAKIATKRMRRKWVIIGSVFGVVLIAGIIAFFVFTSSTPEEAALKPDPNVQIGTLTGATENLDKIVDEGMLTFSINTTPSFETGTSPGNLMIENSEINNNRFTVTIYRDDNKETIYKSGSLDPGQYINDVPLDVNLPVGQYPCTAQFNTYSLDDNKPIGQAAAKITIHVLS